MGKFKEQMMLAETKLAHARLDEADVKTVMGLAEHGVTTLSEAFPEQKRGLPTFAPAGVTTRAKADLGPQKPQ